MLDRSARAASISPLRLALRKLTALRMVAQRPAEAHKTPRELLEQIAALQAAATRAPAAGLAAKTRALWSLERLGCSFGRGAGPDDSLADRRLSDATSPIVHVGMGVAAVERGGFHPDAVTQVIERLARPRDRLFAYESLGAMLGVYERTLPRWFVGLRPLARPDPRGFIGGFPPPVQQRIAHGYGRLLYFQRVSLRSALAGAARPFVDPARCVQGIAFAHAMVNHAALPRVLATATPAELRMPFETGIIYALMFWDWLFPGTLDAPSVPAHALVERARVELARARARGRLPAFRLTDADEA